MSDIPAFSAPVRRALIEITSRLASSDHTDALFQSILTQAISITGAEGGTIFTYNNRRGELDFKFVVSPDTAVSNRLKGRSIPLGSGVAGKAAESLAVDLVPDTSKDPRFEKGVDRQSGFKTHSILTVPLHYFDANAYEQKLVGVLQVINKIEGGFTPNDATTLEAVGGIAASLLTRAVLTDRLKEQFLGMVESLAEAVDAKDPYTAGHSRRVMQYSLALGRAEGFTPLALESLRVGALLHDIGKIAVPDHILCKAGPLDDEEYRIIKTHVDEGVRITKPVEMDAGVYEGIEAHHERWDGKGYPNGLKGEGIPINGRIIAFADAFDTITTARPYKEAFSADVGRERIQEAAKLHFDPRLAEIFCELPLEEIGKDC
jgi:putative nucleotidyltransferase with HDIG domain